jgi:uncharacterized protein
MNLPAPLLIGLIFFATSQGASAPSVSWATLKTLNSSQASSPARDLNGKRIAVPGFMVPLEDDADRVTEFILVPFAGACIHVPPPPPNQMIYVKLTHNQKVKMSFTDPVLVTGMLHVTTVQSPYGDISFNMDADLVRPYEQ